MIPLFKPLSLLAHSIAALYRRPGFRMLIMVFSAVLFASVAAPHATAQDIFRRISGTVAEPTGAVIPGAKVTITNEETKLARTITADNRGFYVAPELPVGAYSVTAEQKGFKTTTKSGNDLVAGARMTVDLTLQIGAV